MRLMPAAILSLPTNPKATATALPVPSDTPSIVPATAKVKIPPATCAPPRIWFSYLL
ncbi:hypothetical protein PT276_06285 [Orbaceae bacterium ESL0721]|nr:hypothetical protein [Orbaceae bacterium ESL0721]